MFKLFNLIDKKHKAFALLTTILTFLQVITDLLVPSFLSPLIMIIATKDIDGAKFNIFLLNENWTIMEGLTKNDALMYCSIFMILFSIIGIMFGLVSSWLASKVAVETGRVVRYKLFTKIQSLSASNMAKFGTSSLITRLTNDVTQVQTIIITILRLMFRAPFLFIGGLIFSLLTNLKLSITLAVLIPLMIGLIAYTAWKVMPLFKKNQIIVDEINKESRENILGARVIKSFNLEEIQSEKFHKVNNEWEIVSTKAFSILNIIIPLATFITNISMILMCVIARTMLVDYNKYLEMAEISAQLTTFAQYLGYVTGGIILTVMLLVMVVRSRISAIRIIEVFNEKPSIDENKSNIVIETPNIEFENVSFKYSDDSENVLENINFSIKEGETLGIIGPTGSGKSTLVNLISRNYDVTEGEIRIDGKNVKHINSINLNNSISQVLQESVLFSGTIKSNLLFGKEDATSEEINEAIEIACAKQFIESFEDGLNHKVEQRGKNLSGGQKQRLQISRGIIRKPKILILDDSTSALDTITDKTLRSNIKKYMKGTTTIIIAQKINSIQDANKIIVLDEGKIVGYDTHKNLIKKCELYKEIASSQLSKEELKNV